MSFVPLKPATLASMASVSTVAETPMMDAESPASPELLSEKEYVDRSVQRFAFLRSRSTAFALLGSCIVMLVIATVSYRQGTYAKEAKEAALETTTTTPESLLSYLMVADSLESGGACLNSADKNVWQGGGRANFGDAMSKCGKDCWGGADCVGKCMGKDEGYSQSCAECFGDMASCSRDNCAIRCMFGGSSCDKCVEKHCRPAMRSCSGLID